MQILLRAGISLLLLGLIASVLFTSCMTFRKSDAKSLKYFKEKEVAVQIHREKVDQQELRYLEANRLDARAPLIVFVHGAPGGVDNFYSYLADSQLLAKAHMVSIDRPGYGYSNYGKAEVSIAKQAEAVYDVVQDFPEATTIILVGHSYGGPIVAKCVVQHPDKFSAIMMLAPVMDPESEKVFWFAHFSQWILTRWMMSKALRVSGDEKFAHIAELHKMENDWDKINIPVVHIHGAKDKMLAPPGNIEFSKTHIRPKFLNLLILPEGDHLIPFNDKEVVRKELLNLLASINN